MLHSVALVFGGSVWGGLAERKERSRAGSTLSSPVPTPARELPVWGRSSWPPSVRDAKRRRRCWRDHKGAVARRDDLPAADLEVCRVGQGPASPAPSGRPCPAPSPPPSGHQPSGAISLSWVSRAAAELDVRSRPFFPNDPHIHPQLKIAVAPPSSLKYPPDQTRC